MHSWQSILQYLIQEKQFNDQKKLMVNTIIWEDVSWEGTVVQMKQKFTWFMQA